MQTLEIVLLLVVALGIPAGLHLLVRRRVAARGARPVSFREPVVLALWLVLTALLLGGIALFGGSLGPLAAIGVFLVVVYVRLRTHGTLR
jgi:hypothetical protein